MKFLAILGDSFREAVDTKVFTVQVGLGIILVLFLASYSVEPVPAQTAFQLIVVNLNHGRDPARFGGRVAMAGGGGIDLVPFQFVGAEPLEGAPDHPDSPFRVTLKVQFASVGPADRARADPEPTAALLRDQFGNQGNRRI